jgi:hypothetical protein
MLPPAALAADQTVKASRSWQGRIEVKLLKEAPATGYIAGPKAFAKLWKAWRPKEKVAKVDFAKELVLVGTTRGSSMGITPSLDDKGNLKVLTLRTSDLRPDAGYKFVVIPLAGIKTINGKKLVREALGPEPPG